MSDARRIYVASSWRCQAQPEVVEFLRTWGHEVYDFRRPRPGNDGFKWSEIDPDWIAWDASEFRRGLDHPVTQAGFASDMDALEWCDTCVLVLPCGRSAHLELGWAVGAGKLTIAVLTDGEPELMYRMVDHLVVTRGELLEALGHGVRAAA